MVLSAVLVATTSPMESWVIGLRVGVACAAVLLGCVFLGTYSLGIEQAGQEGRTALTVTTPEIQESFNSDIGAVVNDDAREEQFDSRRADPKKTSVNPVADSPALRVAAICEYAGLGLLFTSLLSHYGELQQLGITSDTPVLLQE